MDLAIQSTEGGVFHITVNETTTLCQLKSKIKEEQEISVKTLVFLGFDLTDHDDLLVKDCVWTGNKTFLIFPPRTPGQYEEPKRIRIRDATCVQVVVGDVHNFQSFGIRPNKDMSFEAKPVFGLVYREEIGKQKFTAHVYEVGNEKGRIEVRRDDDKVNAKAFFIPDSDQPEKELVGKIREYDEGMTRQESILANIEKSASVIGRLVFGASETLPDDLGGSIKMTEEEKEESRQNILEEKDNCPIGYWKLILKEFITSTKMVDKAIWAIQELYEINQVFEMTVEAFNFAQRHMKKTLSKKDLKKIKCADEQSKDNLIKSAANSAQNRNKDLKKSFSEQTFSVMPQWWKLILRKVLPDYTNLIEAIETLYTDGETDLPSLATAQQVQRFSKLGVTSMAQFSSIIDQLSKDLLQSEKLLFAKSRDIENEPNDSFDTLYDVILQQEMPQTEDKKKDLMSAIEGFFESIRNDTFLQEFLVAKHDILAKESGLEPLGSISSFDWNDFQIEVINIIFGSKTHCLIKMRLSNSDEKYDLPTIQNINILFKIAAESVDTFTRRKIKIKKPSEWRGRNTGELSVKLTWDRSWFKSLLRRQPQEEEDIQQVAIDLIRKIPSEMKSEEQKKKLKLKLCNEYGFIPRDVDDLIKQFEMLPLTEKDAMKIDIEMRCGYSNTMKKIASNVPLWPYMERKLNEIDDTAVRTGFSRLCIQDGLPASIANVFITHLDIFKENEKLYAEALEDQDTTEPFHKIFNLYKENGGTFGGWLQSLETCRDDPKEPVRKAFENENKTRQENEDKRKLVFNSIITETMKIYNDWYSRWEGKYKDLPTLITNFEEFEHQFKTHGISNFQRMGKNELKENLQVGDQIWLFRDAFGGYAHVLFYLGCYADALDGVPQHYVVHVHQNKVFHKGIGLIKKDKFDDVIKESDKGFIVRIEDLSPAERDQMVKRAEACINPPIQFSYNGFSGNCESCVNAFYGVWDDEMTSHQGNEVSTGPRRHSTMNTIARALILATQRGSDEDLRNKMKKRFTEVNLD